eukprot:1335341-Amorphochlora_amoeboformis.AAC.2
MASSHYTTLGISPMASNAEVRHAYRNLAKKWHPDSLPESKKAEGMPKVSGKICLLSARQPIAFPGVQTMYADKHMIQDASIRNL